jgi:hypothetical protein
MLHMGPFMLQSCCIKNAQGLHMATISKLPSGKFRAQIRRQGLYKARTFFRKLDARAWSLELEKSIESGRGVGVMQAPTGMTLADLIEAYLTQVRVTNATDKTLLAFSRVIGGVSIRQLTSFHMQQWVDHRRRQDVSGATIARNHGMISSLLRWAKFIKHIEVDEDLAHNARRALAASRIADHQSRAAKGAQLCPFLTATDGVMPVALTKSGDATSVL